MFYPRLFCLLSLVIFSVPSFAQKSTGSKNLSFDEYVARAIDDFTKVEKREMSRNKVFHIYVPDVYIPKGCSEDDVIFEIFGSDSLKSIILLEFDDTNCVIKQNLTPGEESMSLYDTLYHKVIASIKGCEGDLSEYNGMESISVYDSTRIIDRRYILFGPGFAESKGRLFVWGGVDNPHKEIIEVNEKYNNIQTIFPYMAVCRDYYVDNESVLYIFKKGDIRKMRKKKLGSPLTESSMFDFYPVWYYTPKSLKIQ